jgi:arginine/lysine/ornithine decarboxylase
MSVDHFMQCIKRLEQEPKDGTLYEYSERLSKVAVWWYPAGVPRLVEGRIVCLVREKEQSVQLSLI